MGFELAYQKRFLLGRNECLHRSLRFIRLIRDFLDIECWLTEAQELATIVPLPLDAQPSSQTIMAEWPQKVYVTISNA